MILLTIALLLLGLEIFIGVRVWNSKLGAFRFPILGGIFIAVAFTCLIISVAGSEIISPGDSILSRFERYAKKQHKEALAASEASMSMAVEIDFYSECAAAAKTVDEIEKCKEILSPELRAKMDAQKSQPPGFEDFPPTSENPAPPEQVPLTVNCQKPELTAEKTVCSTPELKALNLRLAKFTEKRLQTRPPVELYHWWKELKACDDDLSCLKKQFDDEIYRMTHE